MQEFGINIGKALRHFCKSVIGASVPPSDELRGVLDVKSISSNIDGSNENWFAAGDCRLLHLWLLARLARCKVSDGTEVKER